MKIATLTLLSATLLAAGQVGAAPVTYICDYKTYSDKNGLHKVSNPFVLTFLFDASTKKAYLIGNNGSEEVRPFVQDAGMTLVEVTAVGNIMVTAITTDGKSVHSRTGILLGEIVPSQYYGECKLQ
jgi:hypothetical protein